MTTTTTRVSVCDSCGSPTLWLPIDGYENYEVSNKGEVKNIKTDRILKPRLRRGYYAIDLKDELGDNKTFYVHALVCTAFHGPRPDGNFACHYPDPTKTNNHADNLEWSTPKKNMQDWIEHGAIRRKAKRVKDEDVREMHLMHAHGLSQDKIADLFGIHQTTVNKILTGARRGHLISN